MTTTEKIIIYSDRLTKDNPLLIKWSGVDWAKIEFAEMRVVLGAQKGLSIPLVSWALKEIRVNNKSFKPSNAVDSRNVIHQLPNDRRRSFNVGQNLTTGENTFQIFRDAPLGTGTLFEQVYIDVTLTITGVKETNPARLLQGNLQKLVSVDSKNIFNKLEDIFKTNLPLAIFIIVFAVAGLIAMAYILSRVPKVENIPSLEGKI